MRTVLALVALSITACNAPIVGYWHDDIAVGWRLRFYEDGRYLQSSVDIQAALTLGAIDPQNPNGWEFRGKYDTTGDLLTLTGSDGLYPKETADVTFVREVSFIVDGDVLGQGLFVPPAGQVGYVGTWQQRTVAERSTSPILGSSDASITATLQLAADGSAQRTEDVAGAPLVDGSHPANPPVLTGAWVETADGVAIEWQSGGAPHKAGRIYRRMSNGALAEHAFTR